MLCDHLEVWDREGGRENTRGRRYGDICIRIADSLCYTAATNTPLQSNYTPIRRVDRGEAKSACNHPGIREKV